MARLLVPARLFCGLGAVVLITAMPTPYPASPQGLNQIVRTLDTAINRSVAQGQGDQSRRQDGRSEEGQYRRPTSEFQGY